MSGRWTGKRALVTGASNGVSLEIARCLAEEGAALVLPVRNRLRGNTAAGSIRASVPDAEIDVRVLDLARPETVTALAAQLLAEGEAIDLYVLNAGIVLLGDPERHLTEQVSSCTSRRTSWATTPSRNSSCPCSGAGVRASPCSSVSPRRAGVWTICSPSVGTTR
ncbi:SDR family NAD(P)-dependent oxidoreductase [Microbacterium sp. NPDC056234]|uniref:SDR family NAD(P)-dependent oxidoreductase n=1 Tax=Microbacterium sp. NPDC056234 TaxID=3345757 RepID=UPI0035DB43AE